MGRGKAADGHQSFRSCLATNPTPQPPSALPGLTAPPKKTENRSLQVLAPSPGARLHATLPSEVLHARLHRSAARRSQPHPPPRLSCRELELHRGRRRPAFLRLQNGRGGPARPSVV